MILPSQEEIPNPGTISTESLPALSQPIASSRAQPGAVWVLQSAQRAWCWEQLAEFRRKRKKKTTPGHVIGEDVKSTQG